MTGGEDAIIREIFAPLSAGAEGAFGLTDDAALIEAGEYVVTKDAIVEGVHYLPDDPPDLVARKLLRVNLSDLAAKGAQPVGYFLACVFGARARRRDVEAFAKGLAADQETFRIRLYGGDTTRHGRADAPAVFSATFFGKPPRAGMVRRAGAAAGDDLYVTGSIGDAGLGLALLRKAKGAAVDGADDLIARYRLPEPRIGFGGALAGLASAALDVSDGLLLDAGRLAKASGARAEIDAAAIPLSAPARAWLGRQRDREAALGKIASFGDDYEILFAAPPSRRRAIEMAATLTKTAATRIGSLVKGEGAALKSADGGIIEVAAAGFDHFSGA